MLNQYKCHGCEPAKRRALSAEQDLKKLGESYNRLHHAATQVYYTWLNTDPINNPEMAEAKKLLAAELKSVSKGPQGEE